MSMQLTTDDLKAIKTIVDEAVDELKLDTAAGFAEVHEKFADADEKFAQIHSDLNNVKEDLSSVKNDLSSVNDDLSSVKQTVERIERVQRAEVERVDAHGLDIKLLKRKLAVS